MGQTLYFGLILYINYYVHIYNVLWPEHAFDFNSEKSLTGFRVSAGEIKTEALFFFKSEIGNRQLLRLNNTCHYHFCNILHICNKIT